LKNANYQEVERSGFGGEFIPCDLICYSLA
jgi:hypothetical protein